MDSVNQLDIICLKEEDLAGLDPSEREPILDLALYRAINNIRSQEQLCREELAKRIGGDAVCSALINQYYLKDKDGFVTATHFGEIRYEQISLYLE